LLKHLLVSDWTSHSWQNCKRLKERTTSVEPVKCRGIGVIVEPWVWALLKAITRIFVPLNGSHTSAANLRRIALD